MSKYFGKSKLRSEDARFLKGLGRYSDDFSMKNMGYMYVIRSPHPSALIRNIDFCEALKIKGVLGIYSYLDIKDHLGTLPCFANYTKSNNQPMYIPNRYILAKNKLVYVGQPIICVVAESLNIAMDAADYVKLDFDILDSVTDIKKAVSSSSHVVWEDCNDNIAFEYSEGNKKKVESLFKRAKHTITIDHSISRVYAAPMESRSALGFYDKSDEKFTLYTGTQGPHNLKKILANNILKICNNKIRVISPDMGGAFGMRSSVYPEMPLVLWFSKLLGRPIKWTASRSEGFLCDDQGRENWSSITLALDKEFNFLALRVKTLASLGAFISSSGASPPTANLGGLAGVYKTPAIAVDVKGVFTNTIPISAYRGAGRPEASFAIERIIDHAAHELKVDPAFLREKNTIPKDLIPFKTGLVFEYDSGNFKENLDKALSRADYNGFLKRYKEREKKNFLRGFGIANVIERSAAMGEESAEIKVDPLGNFSLFVGTHSHGQGHETVFKELISQKFGVDHNDINFFQGDTDLIEKGFGTFGSRSVSLCGSAINIASKQIINKAKKIAAFLLEVNEFDIKFEKGILRVIGTDKILSFKEIAAASYNSERLPKNIKPGLNEKGEFSPISPTFPNGCHCAEIEIDKETGQIKLINYVVVDDVGFVLNPLLLKGQIHGGVVQGIGQILMEEILYDKKSGQLVTASFMDYCMPRASDVPFIEVHSNPYPTKLNPLGVKGAGEAGTVGAMPAVMNAIYNVLYKFNVLSIDMPVTSEKIWRAINSK